MTGGRSIADVLRGGLRRLRDLPWVLLGLVASLRVLNKMGILTAEKYWRHVPYKGVVAVALSGNHSFFMQSNGGSIENGLYWRGIFAHEPVSMSEWIKAAGNARCVLDIGANSGVFSLAAAALGAREVHAFEPVQRVFDILERNRTLNRFSSLRVWPDAVGSERGVATLYDPGGDAPTSASLSAEFAMSHFGDIPASTVKVTTVDAFCTERGISHVDLIKLDIEGYEGHALCGMRATVMRCRPVILMETLAGYEVGLRKKVDELFGPIYDWIRIDEGHGQPSRNVLLRPIRVLQ